MIPAIGLLLALPLSLAAPLALDGVLLVGNGAQAGGFQDYSFNLLGFFNAQFFLPLTGWNSPVFVMQGYAGYAYLGLGVLALLLALLLQLGLARPSMRRRWSPKAVALAIVLLLCLVVALSNRVTLGRHVLFEYGLSGPFLFLSNAFRVPGRFTWPIQDFLVAATVIAVLRCYTANMARGLLILALILQFIDLAPLRSYVKGYIEEPAQGFLQDFEWGLATPGPSPVWTHLGETHRHLVVLPAWQCDNSGTPRGMRGQAIFARLAAEQGMTVNSYRASRYSGDSMAYHCQTLPAQVAAGEMNANGAYVLGDALFLQLARSGGSKTHHCDLVDGLILCQSRPVTDGNWQSVMPPLPQGQSAIGDQR